MNDTNRALIAAAMVIQRDPAIRRFLTANDPQALRQLDRAITAIDGPWSVDYTTAQEFKPGDRVEIHPGSDLWIQGAKYATVDKAHQVELTAHITFDHPEVTKSRLVSYERIRHIPA